VSQVSSTRDICVFCATRQLAVAEALSAASQRRQLNSSSRAPHSVEGVVYKDADPPAKVTSQAERMQQLLAASAARAPPQPQAGHNAMSPAQRMRSTLESQTPRYSQAPSQPLPDRRQTSRGGIFDGPGRSQNRDQFAPTARRVTSRDGYASHQPSPSNRYKVNMDSRPQVSTPAFGSGHLRRRNDPPPERAQWGTDGERQQSITRPAPRRSMLDPDEIAKLLGNTVDRGPPKPFQPLAR